jgi:hypothetical protein
MSANINLIKLIAKNQLLQPGITISAKANVNGFGGVRMTTNRDSTVVSVNDENIVGQFNGKFHKIPFENILAIEGMSVERFAQAYRIKVKKR